MAVTIDDIKDNMQDCEMVTQGDDNIIVRCLHHASVHVDAVVSTADKVIGESIRDAVVIKRTIYEMYIYSSDFQQAQEYKEDANTMLKAALGIAEDGQTRIAAKRPTAAVVEGRNDWNGY